jgi:hypothetical protein
MNEPNTVEPTTTAATEPTTTPDTNAIDLDLFTKRTETGTEGEKKPGETKEPTLAELQAQLDKFKKATDKATSERAQSEREKRELKEKLEKLSSSQEESVKTALEENARLKLEKQQREMTFSLAENLKIGKTHTEAIVGSLYAADGNVNVADFENAFSDFVKAFNEQKNKEAEAKIEKAIQDFAAGKKPKSYGNGQATDDVLEAFLKEF